MTSKLYKRKLRLKDRINSLAKEKEEVMPKKQPKEESREEPRPDDNYTTLEAFRGDMEFLMSTQIEMARLLKHKFDSLVTAGFTESQAMRIVIHQGLSSGAETE